MLTVVVDVAVSEITALALALEVAVAQPRHPADKETAIKVDMPAHIRAQAARLFISQALAPTPATPPAEVLEPLAREPAQ